MGYCHGHGPSARSSQDGGSFLSVSTYSELTFSFVAVVRDAIAASSFSGTVITWETVSRSGTARISSTIAALLEVPRGLFKLVGELTTDSVLKPTTGGWFVVALFNSKQFSRNVPASEPNAPQAVM